VSQENLDLFRQGIAAWNAGDYETIVEMCHPDVEWTRQIVRFRGFGTFDEALEAVGQPE
jgi:hypothetical protein